MNARILIWTVFCLSIEGLIVWFLGTENFYVGNDITLITDDSYQFVINTEPFTIEAESSNDFLLRSSEDEIVKGIPSDWQNKEYYQTEPREVYGRIWLIESGRNIAVHLSSLDRITVRESLQNSVKVTHTFLTTSYMILIWLLGLWLISRSKVGEPKSE